MPRRPLTLALIAVTAVAMLVPLYGDPRQVPLTHPEWARLILRGLDLEESLDFTETASQAFAALSWRVSLALPADRYLRADGVAPVERDGVRGLRASETGEVSYHMPVVRSGDYRLRFRIGGDTDTQSFAEVVPWGGDRAVDEFAMDLSPQTQWVDAGSVYLTPGTYTTAVQLPPAGILEYVELAPPCINPIEPLRGLRPTAIATVQDVARTTLQAVDLEHELPPADTPIEYGGSDFKTTDGELMLIAAEVEGSTALVAGDDGKTAVLICEIPEDGIYSISTFGIRGGGQAWVADSCQKQVLCASSDVHTGWSPVLTNLFSAGRHELAVRLGPGAVVQRVRIERKKHGPEDYVGTLRRLGLDLGEGIEAATRDQAVDAMEFIDKRRRGLDADVSCFDLPIVEAAKVADAAGAPAGGAIALPSQPGAPTGPGIPPGGPGLGPPSEGGFPPGIDPEQPPASPVVIR